jgi:hypothetical protein
MPSQSPSTRDSGLRAVGRATRWIAGAAIALTGVFAIAEVRGATSTSPTPATATRTQPTTGSARSDESRSDERGSDEAESDDGAAQAPSSTYADPGLQAPSRVPAPSSQPPVASSGGS